MAFMTCWLIWDRCGHKCSWCGTHWSVKNVGGSRALNWEQGPSMTHCVTVLFNSGPPSDHRHLTHIFRRLMLQLWAITTQINSFSMKENSKPFSVNYQFYSGRCMQFTLELPGGQTTKLLNSALCHTSNKFIKVTHSMC